MKKEHGAQCIRWNVNIHQMESEHGKVQLEYQKIIKEIEDNKGVKSDSCLLQYQRDINDAIEKRKEAQYEMEEYQRKIKHLQEVEELKMDGLNKLSEIDSRQSSILKEIKEVLHINEILKPLPSQQKEPVKTNAKPAAKKKTLPAKKQVSPSSSTSSPSPSAPLNSSSKVSPSTAVTKPASSTLNTTPASTTVSTPNVPPSTIVGVAQTKNIPGLIEKTNLITPITSLPPSAPSPSNTPLPLKANSSSPKVSPPTTSKPSSAPTTPAAKPVNVPPNAPLSTTLKPAIKPASAPVTPTATRPLSVASRTTIANPTLVSSSPFNLSNTNTSAERSMEFEREPPLLENDSQSSDGDAANNHEENQKKRRRLDADIEFVRMIQEYAPNMHSAMEPEVLFEKGNIRKKWTKEKGDSFRLFWNFLMNDCHFSVHVSDGKAKFYVSTPVDDSVSNDRRKRKPLKYRVEGGEIQPH
eukprot:TRINITY_DN5044_c0_g1_i1.p1 TRINITY_DN5044_c0_g1~~TRINITY_DN5044_c0_g1_i1.p1  ORF type:complete len:468 (-),score=146.48 TRINITY_DN5044_c0_g1_i1:83-1486(-)